MNEETLNTTNNDGKIKYLGAEGLSALIGKIKQGISDSTSPLMIDELKNLDFNPIEGSENISYEIIGVDIYKSIINKIKKAYNESKRLLIQSEKANDNKAYEAQVEAFVKDNNNLSFYLTVSSNNVSRAYYFEPYSQSDTEYPQDEGDYCAIIVDYPMLDHDIIVNDIDEIKTTLDNKVDKVEGKQLSSNDFTDEDKEKLNSLENFDDTEIKSSINDIEENLNNVYTKTEVDDKFVEQEDGKQLSSNDYTTDEKNKLNALPTNLALEATLDNKVDKVSGKQLSTEDFTATLKQKLEELAISVPDIDSRLTQLKTTLDTLIDDGSIDTVINSFIEVQNFLAGITNQQTLAGMLLDLRNDIVSLCASTYLPKPNGGTANNLILGNGSLVEIDEDSANPNNIPNNLGVIKMILDNAIEKPENGTSSQFVKGDGSLDSTAYIPVNGDVEIGGNKTFTRSILYNLNIAQDGNDIAKGLYYNINKNDTKPVNGMGVYRNIDSTTREEINRYWYLGWGNNPHSGSTSLAISDTRFTYKNNKVWHEGNDGDGSGLDADKLDGYQGDMFLRAFNRDVTSLNLNTYTDFGFKEINYTELNITNSPTTENAGLLNLWTPTKLIGAQIIFTNNNKVFIRAKQDSNTTITKPWKQIAFTDSNVASADKLTTKQLTNENLNNIKDIEFSSYAGVNGNTCTNKPDGISSFGLQSYAVRNDLYCQVITNAANGDTYKRTFNGTSWSAWKKMLTEDDVVNLKNDVETLKNLLLDSNGNPKVALNGNTGLIKTWTGTQNDYNSITDKDPDTFYFITES